MELCVSPTIEPYMRTFNFLIGFFISVTAGCGTASSEYAKKKSPIYGTQSVTTITIKIGGEGIEKPVTYHLPSETSLLALVKQAGLSRISNGRFNVSREVDGYKRNFGFRMSRTKQPPLPDFPLADGDYIYAGINLP